ncbi:MAG TPA: glycosyltransferase family 9 protein, partial [Verrucomicrobiae bacterium]|nr:glycosyltransferase family 9 protein [Verrucomicrobiae bacterium]
PEEKWVALGRCARERGLKIVLPWGNEEEKSRARRLAGEFEGEVLPRMAIAELAGLLADATFVVGLDTGLTHLAVAVGTPTISLYGPSVPVYGGLGENRVVHLTSTSSTRVDTRRPNSVPLERAREVIERWIALAPAEKPRGTSGEQSG